MLPILAILILVQASALGATWYASGTGTETNGTQAQPWSLPYAVTNSNPYLSPGDTVLLMNGSFTCTETNTTYNSGKTLEFRKAGTAGSKITYRSQTLWGFSFNGGVLFTPASSNIVLHGVRLHYSGMTNRQQNSEYEFPSGPNVFAEGVELLHNLIENTGHPGIGSWIPTKGKLIAGNIVRFIGLNDYVGYPGTARGSGMYMQNEDNTSEALIAGNISYFNYTTGMKAYGNTDIWGFRFVHNICAENHEAGIFAHQDNYGMTNLIVHTNFIWNGNPGIRLGYPLGNGGHEAASIVGNYVVEESAGSQPFYMVDGWSDVTFTGNTGVQLADRYVWLLEVNGEASGDTASHTMSGNTYYGFNAGGVGSGPFLIKEASKSLAQWKSETTTDADATYTTGAPTDLVSYVFRPSADTNFVHVAVFNWPTNETTEVDLSGYFSSGDILHVYDAQNIPVVASSVNYSNNVMVTLPLTLTNRATMVGEFTAPTLTWSGFDPRFRAFVIHKSGVWQAPPKKPRRNGPGRFRGM